MLDNLSVLVTGGTGSFGRAFVQTVLQRWPGVKRLVVYSRDELKQYEMAQWAASLGGGRPHPGLRFFIGDIRDPARLRRALEGVDVVVHAAALKQVPAAEYNPFECIKTNVLGAQNLIEACLDNRVSRVVALSTDKAAAPINLYGATKLCSDKLFVAANNIKGARELRFSVVRYGNVMGSRGSVIPFFEQQRASGELPITDPAMTRFNISLHEGVEMVLWALERAWGGEILVPKIPSYRITDVAEAVAPGARQRIVGIRPGEKLHEEMITASDSPHTVDLGAYYAILPTGGEYSVDEYCSRMNARLVPAGFSYDSGSNPYFLSVQELRDLIAAHHRGEPPAAREPSPREAAQQALAQLAARAAGSTAAPAEAGAAAGDAPASPAAEKPGRRPFIPYSRQQVSEDDIRAVTAVLRSDFLTQGQEVPRFEARFAQLHQVAHAVAVCNATAALHLACLALGVGEGSRVWTSPNSFLASANCARYCGAQVDFVDIDPQTRNMDVLALAAKLRQAQRNGTLPQVVIPVDFAGLPCDLADMRALADEYGFSLLEDASHATGASYRGRPVGSQHAHATVFSFHAVKIVTTAEGGMVVTQDAALAERLRLLRSHGSTREAGQMTRPPDGAWVYEQQALGFNARMTELQAALGCSQLDRLPQMHQRREALAARYDRLLADLPVRLPARRADRRSAWHLYVVELDAARTACTRAQVFQALRQAEVGVNVHYIPIHTQPYYQGLGFRPGDFPHAEAYYAQAVSLPLYPELTEADQDHVVQVLRQALAAPVVRTGTADSAAAERVGPATTHERVGG